MVASAFRSKLKVMKRDTWHLLLGITLAVYITMAGACVFLMMSLH
jgi:hypothetical protein